MMDPMELILVLDATLGIRKGNQRSENEAPSEAGDLRSRCLTKKRRNGSQRMAAIPGKSLENVVF